MVMALFLRHILQLIWGTVSVLVHVQGRGLLQEPSVVAIRDDGTRTVIVEAGRVAREMYGRTPEEIGSDARPLREGVIADYFVTEAMLRYFIDKVSGRINLRRPVVMVTVPYGVTSVEKRAVREATLTAGAGSPFDP